MHKGDNGAWQSYLVTVAGTGFTPRAEPLREFGSPCKMLIESECHPAEIGVETGRADDNRITPFSRAAGIYNPDHSAAHAESVLCRASRAGEHCVRVNRN